MNLKHCQCYIIVQVQVTVWHRADAVETRCRCTGMSKHGASAHLPPEPQAPRAGSSIMISVTVTQIRVKWTWRSRCLAGYAVGRSISNGPIRAIIFRDDVEECSFLRGHCSGPAPCDCRHSNWCGDKAIDYRSLWTASKYFGHGCPPELLRQVSSQELDILCYLLIIAAIKSCDVSPVIVIKHRFCNLIFHLTG